MGFKYTGVPETTVTLNRDTLTSEHVNLYEVINILAKRSKQISAELKSELLEKLEEFAVQVDSLEEVLENREQIEISRHYEGLPKPTAIATKELLDDEIYFRHPDEKD